MKIPYLALVFILVAMVFVGANAFGNVNQFELETGLTVETLMFPEGEKTVEASGVYFATLPFAEYAVAQVGLFTVMVIAVMAFLITSKRFSFSRKNADAEWGVIRRNVGVRIFGPLQRGLCAAL